MWCLNVSYWIDVLLLNEILCISVLARSYTYFMHNFNSTDHSLFIVFNRQLRILSLN